VFEALTDPAIIQQWSAPEPLRVGEVSNDARVGGRWLIEMIHDEAGERHVAVGRNLEIDSPARLRYTHAWLEDG
jgi:glutathione S-transferase